MKVLLKRRAIIIASSAIIVLLVSVISVNLFNTGGPVSGLVNVISNPLRALASNVASTFEGIYNSIYRYEHLMLQNEALLRRIAELERDDREVIAIAAENDRLRDMLDFRRRHAEYVDEPATVGDWASSNFESSFEINRGYANSAIQLGNAVVTEYGMVIGQISRLEAYTATVITVLDTRFSLGVSVGEAGSIGTLRGDFNYMHEGLMVLDHIDDDAIIVIGESVVTSGFGGVFPPGHMVGNIVEIHQNPTGIGRYATVRPVRDINTTITTVFVIIEFGEAGFDVY